MQRGKKKASEKTNSSDGRVDKASSSGPVDSGLIPSRVKPTTLKLVFTAQHETVWRASRQVCSLCRWERHLAGLPYFGVVDRWSATPKRVQYGALIAFSM